MQVGYAAVVAKREPPPIGRFKIEGRRDRVARIARSLRFLGRIEYRHVYSQTGGTQYCVGPTTDQDLLVVYAEAFDRDRDPSDFSLEAIIAHERGHQVLLRNPNLAAIVERLPGRSYEEVLASLIGSMIASDAADAGFLVEKAAAELANLGLSAVATARTVQRLLDLLRRVL
jgi:hypothetical protein